MEYEWIEEEGRRLRREAEIEGLSVRACHCGIRDAAPQITTHSADIKSGFFFWRSAKRVTDWKTLWTPSRQSARSTRDTASRRSSARRVRPVRRDGERGSRNDSVGTTNEVNDVERTSSWVTGHWEILLSSSWYSGRCTGPSCSRRVARGC